MWLLALLAACSTPAPQTLADCQRICAPDFAIGVNRYEHMCYCSTVGP